MWLFKNGKWTLVLAERPRKRINNGHQQLPEHTGDFLLAVVAVIITAQIMDVQNIFN
jgi:hypothetical protein